MLLLQIEFWKRGVAKLDKMLSGRTGKTLTLALKSLLAKTPLNKTKKEQ